MNRPKHAKPYLTVLLIALVLSWMTPCPVHALNREALTGKRPQALTPFASEDPVPKLEVRPHRQLDSARDVAETFLAFLSVGYDPSLEGHVGGTVMGGDWKGYENAWNLMGDSRPSFNDFQVQWAGTIRMGIIQLEPITPNLFFVELERVAWYKDHWAVSYFAGDLETMKIAQGWRVANFKVCTESLAQPNIIGHTSWHQDDQALAAIIAGFKFGEYDVVARRYERRTVFIQLRDKRSGAMQAFRMARVVEGAWHILEPSRGPICGR